MILVAVAGCLLAAEANRPPLFQIAQMLPPPPLSTVGLSAQVKTGTPATVIDSQNIQRILGKKVESSTGEDMGRIIDVLVSPSGEVRAAVIDFGGFLGVGTRKVAVAWKALRFPSTGKFDHLTLALTRDQVRVAPEYRPGQPVVILGSPRKSSSTTAPLPRSEN